MVMTVSAGQPGANPGGAPARADSPRTGGARVVPIPPPLYYVAAFVGGRLLDQWTHWRIGGGWVSSALGWITIVGGLGLVAWAIVGVVVHRTFGRSRNPMYTGLAVAYVGLTLVTGSWWPLATLPLAVAAVRILVIGPEERYLATEYAEEFAEYRVRVRRWF
jgi:protein-S-isoprenylcysteine O-methyltransferase Ste14